jgi:hypothetical protein
MVALSRAAGALKTGGRYIMFFHSGSWTEMPFELGPESIYRVDDKTGFVTCGSGHVLGIDPTGVVCGVVDTHVIAPMTEAEFVGRLNREYTRAQSRRPALAAQMSAKTQKYSADPTR